LSALRGYSDGALGIVLLNTGDNVLVMLSNNANEFGVRFVKEFCGPSSHVHVKR
jgi:hypothetical protein